MTAETEFGAGHVFILGAGFSRAVGEDMPLTDELGNECSKRMERMDRAHVPRTFRGGAFEPFMSMLAVPQPYLTDSENLRNARLFGEFSNAIAEVLADRQFRTESHPAPRWLEDLVATWHHTRSTVVTFNYDTLVESAANPVAGLLNRWGTEGSDTHMAWPSLTNNQPPEPPGLMHQRELNRPTLRLLKLHGSVNWFWQPGDSTGMTAARRVPPGRFGSPGRYDREDTARWWPGRVPMIIPPTASKSSYYRSPLIREMWQQARDMLADAAQVHIVGYSLPPTDVSTRELLRTALVPGRSRVVIADPNAGAVRSNLSSAGIPRSRIDAAHLTVEGLAEETVERRSAAVLEGLRSLTEEEQNAVAAVHWGDQAYAVVVGVTRIGGALVLTVDQPARLLTHACRSRNPQERPGVRIRDLLARGAADAFRVEAGDDSAYVVAEERYAQNQGHSIHWRLLTLSRTFRGAAVGQLPVPNWTFTLPTSEWE